MKEVDNVLRIFEKAKESIEKEDVFLLKELSDQTIHTASIAQDPDNIAVAVIIYSLGKIIQRKQYQEYPGWKPFYIKLMKDIESFIEALRKNNEKKFKKCLEDIRKNIDGLSGDLKRNISDVFRKASINKASKIYEHGISMEQTAKLLGISMFELASFSGQTGISDAPLGKTLDVKSRIKLAMEMFE